MLTDLQFDLSLCEGFKSKSQAVRVMSEQWFATNMYCPCCGNSRLVKQKNNEPAFDFLCEQCGENFELKSHSKESKKVPDGSYNTMIARIKSDSNPALFLLQYAIDYEVVNLTLTPSFFLTPDYIEARKPLPPTARRSGWQGCDILYGAIPIQGKIPIIKDSRVIEVASVVKRYERLKGLYTSRIETRGWLLDVLSCVNEIDRQEFTLRDVYQFVDVLQEKHEQNRHVKDKIRQQLQRLRDSNVIEFLGNGHYRKVSYLTNL